MKNPEKQWIKKGNTVMILVMQQCLRSYLLIFWPKKVCFKVIKRLDTLNFYYIKLDYFSFFKLNVFEQKHNMFGQISDGAK